MTKENLRKKIIDIIVDYHLNSTRIETTEMIADRIIDIITNKNIEDIENHIKEVLLRYYNSEQDIVDQHMHSRIDELFLLWGKLKQQNFVLTCEDFGIIYQDFTNSNHSRIKNQINIFLKI